MCDRRTRNEYQRERQQDNRALANGTNAGDAISFGQPSGGDLSGAIPNPTVATVLGGQVPVTKSTAMTGGDLSGTLPAPTVQTVLGGKAPIYAGQTGAQIDTLSGSKGDGSDAITSFNVNGVLNAKAYGAKGDGSTDDTAAIYAATNAGCSSGGPVMLPPATGYKITSPLWENCNNGSLIGNGGLGPIQPAYDFGFTIALVGATYPGIPLTTSLVTGAGNAFDFRSDQTHNWLNLREWDGVDGPLGSPSGLNMNGLGTFSVEAFVNDVTAGDGDVVSSDSVPWSAGETDSWLLNKRRALGFYDDNDGRQLRRVGERLRRNAWHESICGRDLRRSYLPPLCLHAGQHQLRRHGKRKSNRESRARPNRGRDYRAVDGAGLAQWRRDTEAPSRALSTRCEFPKSRATPAR